MRGTGILEKCLMLMIPALAIVFLSTTTHGEYVKMQPLFDLKNATISLKPRIYKVGAISSYSLFPVPQDNAVGTNDHADAITIISFPNVQIELDNYFKKAVHEVYGGGTYLPVISPDMIGFGQVRRFMLFNFKTKMHEEYRIVYSFDDTIESISIADAGKRRFIFKIEAQNPHSSNHWDIKYFLCLVDLESRDVNMLKKMDIGKGVIWTVSDNKLLLWYFRKKDMKAFDMNLEPSQHPLADVVNRNKKMMDFIVPNPHPSLPFAILSGGKEGTYFISWEEGRSKSPSLILDDAEQISFSPDGKWVTFKREDFARDKKMTYLMPVSEKYPNYLGTPILLRDDYFLPDHFTWTKNPVSFVGSSGGDIYRWELTNEAHPESDRATFHDYIVEKDLERLARAGEQAWVKIKTEWNKKSVRSHDLKSVYECCN